MCSGATFAVSAGRVGAARALPPSTPPPAVATAPAAEHVSAAADQVHFGAMMVRTAIEFKRQIGLKATCWPTWFTILLSSTSFGVLLHLPLVERAGHRLSRRCDVDLAGANVVCRPSAVDLVIAGHRMLGGGVCGVIRGRGLCRNRTVVDDPSTFGSVRAGPESGVGTRNIRSD